jgi:hypothetical protein
LVEERAAEHRVRQPEEPDHGAGHLTLAANEFLTMVSPHLIG